MKLVSLELKKIKHTSMYLIVISLSLLPVLLIALQYLISGEVEKRFYSAVAGNNIIITICLYAALIILANYIMTREYRDRTVSYLFLTPQSRLKVLASKYGLLFLMLFSLGVITYGSLLLLTLVFDGADGEIMGKLLSAWIMNVLLSFLFMPFVVMIALWRKGFISSLMVPLVLIIFTTPFLFTEKVYAFPHLIPMAVPMNILRIDHKLDINYPCAVIILVLVCILCSFVSLKLFYKKE